MRNSYVVLLSLAMIGCMTESNVQQFSMSNGKYMYFIPPTKWHGKNIYAEIDFNYKTEEGTDTICNISIINKKNLPRGISSMIFVGDNISYKLTGLNILFTESRNKKIRVNTIFDRDDFLQFIRSNEMYFEIIITQKKYKLLPTKEFIRLRADFINDLEGKEEGILE